ncbi:hypothetical protein [Streptomyces sp. MP131-18]|uniref:hypothetical protein n=1 Tax=Streptomyces sp. MP131-18 TaxID=1857892 RepID=UPI0015C5415F|nr:hypothetical protein [Streptomyces sp. MP131-18]
MTISPERQYAAPRWKPAAPPRPRRTTRLRAAWTHAAFGLVRLLAGRTAGRDG